MSTPSPTPAYPGPYPTYGRPVNPLTYLEGSPVGFGAAIKQGFSNGFVYRGRASRSAYWWFYLFTLIVNVAFDAMIFIPLQVTTGGSSFPLTAFFVILAIFVIGGIYLYLVQLALLVRRLHDTDRSGWWVLICLVPFVGPITLLIFTLLEGTRGPNSYQP
ncbi:MAG TPA: DUF805 domain-containing protein [Streptosporangiaceae bacterium]|nr:DUF805 domain-containing protein [Streptosporangiaceae bacterium]